MNYLLPERLQALARDHAIGTLTGGARRRFERLVREHPQAAQVAAQWQSSLAPLAAEVPPIEPREAVWLGLQARLFKPTSVPNQTKAPWWQRWFAAPAGVLAGALLCTLVLQQNPAWIGHEAYQEALPQSYVGLLSDSAGKPTVLASSRRHGRTLTLKMLQPIDPPAGTEARLWALPKDGSAPVPLGPVPAKGSATLALSAASEKLFFSVERLAVSFEPTGADALRPSQPFVISGPCVKLW